MSPGNNQTAGELPSGVHIENAHPERAVDTERIADLVRRIAERESVEIQYLGIVLTDHETVLELNRTYLEHDYLTDVLSFPLRAVETAEGSVEGEIYVDLDTAAERAPEFNATFEEETCRYVVHGLLHLLGYDDQSEEGQQTMQQLEEQYLAAM